MPSVEEGAVKRSGAEQWLSSSEDDALTSSSHSPYATGSQSPSAEEEHSNRYQDFESQIHLELPWWRDQDAIVVSGVSCRFPESDNMEEFKQNLFNGVDMVTEDDKRWEPGLYGLPKRHGKVRDFSKFDAQFFGVPPKQANFMDPQLRTLLQVSYEAILDSGTNPLKLRGTKTGVFVGSSGSESIAHWTRDPDTVTGYSMNGCAQSMFANRLSYSFDFRGPSFAVDTACNSSLLAFQLAVTSLREGQCTAALVCGANATLTPTNALQFYRLGVTGSDGACRSFDANGLGYAKSEGIGAILLQRSSKAHRIYCTVIHSKSNTDGYKEAGITFPSGERQAELLREVYQESGVDPSSVAYVEAHGTGTKVGDPQETGAITQVFLPHRTEPLLIGSVKSNMGHAEPASGVASVAKVILAMEAGIIPPNLHFTEPNPYIPALIDGRLKVVTEPTAWSGGFVGINSFGFGGANTHLLLKSAENDTEQQDLPIQPDIPRLVCFSGRVPQGLELFLDEAEANRDNLHFLHLLQEQSASPLNLFPHRGFMITNRESGEPIREIQKVSVYEKRPVWFIFSGMGTQWAGMGRDLMAIDSFRKSILESSEVLRTLGTDPYSLLMQSHKDVFKNVKNSIVCNTAIQLALTDLLRDLGINPDAIIGHSTGEIACGYCDGGLSREQAMLLAYHRGETILKASFPPGAMAAVGLTWEDAAAKLPPGVVPACHNGYDSVTISGEEAKVMQFVEELKVEGVFAKLVDSSGIAFHSPCMQEIAQTLTDKFKSIIPEAKPRTKKWISTSTSAAQSEMGAYCSAEYHVNNITSPVLFYEALQTIPEESITIEIAPHALLQAILRRTLPQSCTNIGLMKAKHENSVEFLLRAIGKIYCTGLNPDLAALYPQPTFPVPRGTPMLGSLMRWDHSHSYPVCDGRSDDNKSGSSLTVDPHDPENTENKFLLDHVIDGRAIYPFTGYPVMAWKMLCKAQNLDFKTTGVIFEELNVYRPTFLSKPVKFNLVLSPGTGEFEVMEGDAIVASGTITLVPESSERPFFYERFKIPVEDEEDGELRLKTPDVYKEFLIRGYEYGPEFRGIEEFNLDGTRGKLTWNGNWVTFLDTLLQSTILAQKSEALRLPVRLHYLRIDPVKHEAAAIELGEKRVIPVTGHEATGGLLAGGVEMRSLVSQAASRRVHHLDLFLERVEYVVHQDINCLSKYPHWCEPLNQYKECCIRALNVLLKNWGTSTLATLPNGCFLKEAFAQTSKDIPEPTPLPKLTTKHTLLPFLQQLGTLNPTSNDFQDLKQTLVQKCAEGLGEDAWLKSAYIVRCIKPLLDIVVDNVATHNRNCCVAEPRGKYPAHTARSLLQSHPQIDTDWVQIGVPIPEEQESDFPVIPVSVEAGDELPDDVEKFDLILLDGVLSRKINPESYLLNLRKLCHDKGFVLIYEPTDNQGLVLLVESLLGHREEVGGDGARIFGRFLPHEKLLQIFQNTGFSLIGFQTDPVILGTMYLIRNAAAPAPDPIIIDIDDVKEFSWIEPLQKAIEERLHEPENKTIWLKSALLDNGTVGLANCFREEYLMQSRFKAIADISLSGQSGGIDANSAEFKKRIAQDLHQNCYRDGTWGSIRGCVMKEELSHQYGLVEHAFITNLVQADLSSLTWVESPNGNITPSATQTLCSVYYASLNFRDIMLATGRLSADSIPGNFSDRDCVLGAEFSGRLPDGRRVMGMLPAQALATSVAVDTSMQHFWEVPDSWSLEEAATVPVVYTTAYHSLFTRGRLQAGEKILVHSGSGGVGMAAIAIALALGCEVFTTVGSVEKKQFLQKRFPQLKDRHFSSSRTLDFEWDILERTGGRGVDVVLNSLSEDKLQASLRCLGSFGRFLEIGKVDMAKNSKIGMELLLKNITIHGVVLDGLEKGWAELNALFREGLRDGVIQPLPATVFASDEVESAFRFMATGKHIGKVVIRIREEEQGVLMTPPRQILVNAIRKSYCNPQHVYLITGGLGGFGIELAQWLTTRGARKLVVTSRGGVRNGYQARNLKIWEKAGISVRVSKLDVSVEAEAKQLIDECLQDGPLGGVFHLAMVLRDSLFENQTAQNFQESAAAKYWGTRYLDNATREKCGPELRWFVAFSSIASGRGNNGQTAYGWANCTMERMMEKRVADGLSGIAIQWGAIGDVGVILQNMGDNSTVVGGTLPQRIPSCLQVLDTFLSWQQPIVGSYVRAETGKKRAGGSGTDIVEAVGRILGVSDISTIDPDTLLVDFGLDSLMGMEIKQAVEREAGIILSMKEIQNMTINKLRKLDDPMSGSKPVAREEETVEDLKKQMFQVFRLRIDVNELLSKDHIVPLNEVKEGKPLFFVHTMEGVAGPLRTLGSLLQVPAYCFQSIPGAPMESFESLAAHYIQVMKTIQPTGPYRISGYSYGAGLAFEMAATLQRNGEAVESLILLDGSHHYMKAYRTMYRIMYGVLDTDLVNNPLFESEIIIAMVMRFASVDLAALRKDLLEEKDWDARVVKATEAVMASGLVENPESFKWICKGVRARFIAGDKYVPQTKFHGDIQLIRASKGTQKEDAVGADYGLSQVADGKVNIYVAEGDHEGFVQGENGVKTAELLMSLLVN